MSLKSGFDTSVIHELVLVLKVLQLQKDGTEGEFDKLVASHVEHNDSWLNQQMERREMQFQYWEENA